MASRTSIAIVGVSACLLVLAGCSAADGRGGGSGASSTSFAMPESVDISDYSDVHAVLDAHNELIVYPIDAYFVDSDGLERIDRATSIQWDSCMRKSGRTYPAIDFNTWTESQDTYYGIWSLERASTLGYDFDQSANAQVDAANSAVIAASQADPGWDAAFDKCINSGDRLPMPGRDYASDDDLAVMGLPTSIRNDARILASKDPGWDEARGEWLDCMSENGLTLDTETMSPWAPIVPDDPEAAIRTAVVDVTCKQKTNLVERLSSLESQYQAAMIDQNIAALNEVAKKERAIVAEADAIIATAGG